MAIQSFFEFTNHSKIQNFSAQHWHDLLCASDLAKGWYWENSTDGLKEADQDHEHYLADNMSANILNTLTHVGVPPHQLDLKQGTIAAIQWNLLVKHSLVKNAPYKLLHCNNEQLVSESSAIHAGPISNVHAQKTVYCTQA